MGKGSAGWHVITGAPSSGKTTIINQLQTLGYQTVEEMGRKLIEREMKSGKTLREIKVDSPAFEEAWVQLQADAESSLDREQLIFFDRGILDTLSYFSFYNWPVPKHIRQLCDQARYQKVFLLELLDFEDDGIRIENADIARAMQEVLKHAYLSRGYDIILIPRATVDERIALIEQHLQS